jgi:hypothetical protein
MWLEVPKQHYSLLSNLPKDAIVSRETNLTRVI